MNVLLIGNGAREQAIAEALCKNKAVELYVFGKATNPGIKKIAREYAVSSLARENFPAILEFAKKAAVEFSVIGPDDPISEGLADALAEISIPSVAPMKAVARVESSKSFTRDLLEKYDIPGNPAFQVFHAMDGVREFVEKLSGESKCPDKGQSAKRTAHDGYVIKADGLMGGKGVMVAGDHLRSVDEAVEFADACIKKFGRVVVEEKLVGQEFSLMSFVDSAGFVADMPVVQDHKRAFEGDTGPNTGGMGTYSSANHLLPFLEKSDVDAAHAISVRVVEALFRETGVRYQGILYGGFMAVRDGVRLIEFNARFGDPEAMNVLPILETDFVEVCLAVIEGRLAGLPVKFSSKATVCKYVVPEGYPEHSRSGEKIVIQGPRESGAGFSAPSDDSLKMFYASVDERDGEILLSSSRAVAFVGIADSLSAAEKIAEQGVKLVFGPVFHRADIGTEKLISGRVDMMKKMRSRKQPGALLK